MTLPDTIGMMEMAAGGHYAVVEAFKEKIQSLAAALGEVHHEEPENSTKTCNHCKVYND